MDNISLDAEKSYLGSVIVDATLVETLECISDDYFGSEVNKYIYSAMLSLYKARKSVDIISIKDRLDEIGLLVDVSYLSELSMLSQAYAIESVMDILKTKALKRNIIKYCNDLINDLGLSRDVDSSIYTFENKIKDILHDDYDEDNICAVSASLLNFLESEDVEVTKFGIKLLDKTIGGIFKGELTTIAAKSGVGKTALALQIMLNVVKQGKKVLFITREMTKEHILMRNITKKTGVSINDMKSRNISEGDWEKIIEVMTEFNKENLIYINDKISTVAQIKKRIRQVKPDVLIVDYVQLLSPTQSMSNREREVASISRELKNITLDFDISAIQLSQLNDELKDSRPWGDRVMRESKALYHDSNNVIYIHEPTLGDFDEAVDAIGQSRGSVIAARDRGIKLVDLIVDKCRDGEKRMKHCCYYGSRLHFQELDY